MIHQTAIIHPSAKLAENVSVGPYSVIGADVEIGEGTVIESHVVIKGITRIGKGNNHFISLAPLVKIARTRNMPENRHVWKLETITFLENRSPSTEARCKTIA